MHIVCNIHVNVNRGHQPRWCSLEYLYLLSYIHSLLQKVMMSSSLLSACLPVFVLLVPFLSEAGNTLRLPDNIEGTKIYFILIHWCVEMHNDDYSLTRVKRSRLPGVCFMGIKYFSPRVYLLLQVAIKSSQAITIKIFSSIRLQLQQLCAVVQPS